jgi:uncharacterized protein
VVPKELTETVNSFRICMKGTNSRPPRCVALQGEAGQPVHCTIYTHRPSTCILFGIAWKQGKLLASAQALEHCNQARQAYHLPPLTLDPSSDDAVPAASSFDPNLELPALFSRIV